MEYNNLTPEVAEKLRAIAPGRVFIGEEINEDYCHDELRFYGDWMPEAVIEVHSAEEISQIFKLANEYMIPVIPRGAGTGLAGGSVAKHGGIVVSTVKMNKILEYDMENLSVRIQPGVLLFDLAADALTRGVMYPPDPGEKFATVGGNVSTNAGGMRAVKYGTTRDYVRSMQVVTPTGEIVTFGANVAKNSSGYNMMHLVIGSEGTLCMITELTLKLVPAPKETVSLIIPFVDLEAAIKTVPQFFLNKLEPQALEFMDIDTVVMIEKFVEKENFPKVVDGVTCGAYLLTTFDGNSKEALEEICEKCAEVVLECGALDVFVADTPDKIRDAWLARSQALEAIQAATETFDECDVVVPRNKIAEYFNFALSLQDKYKVKITGVGHAGDGNIHVFALRTEGQSYEEFCEQVEPAMDELYRRADEIGGLLSGEHGVGHAKVKYLEEFMGDYKIGLMKKIKEVFDPNAILNPGKVCWKVD